jgi:5-methylcytosine-specific restriction endonuclease McrA
MARNTYYHKDDRFKLLDRVHRRRARLAGVVEEKIDLREIFEKTDVCVICNEKMNLDTGQSDRMYVSLDHIIPLKAGGGHTADNVRFVHIFCNNLKDRKKKGESNE